MLEGGWEVPLGSPAGARGMSSELVWCVGFGPVGARWRALRWPKLFVFELETFLGSTPTRREYRLELRTWRGRVIGRVRLPRPFNWLGRNPRGAAHAIYWSCAALPSGDADPSDEARCTSDGV